jgi:hypothetical protein
MKFTASVLGCLSVATLFGIEVVLASFASQKLAALRDLDALAIRLVSFDGHIYDRAI